MEELTLGVVKRRDVEEFDVCGDGVARFYVKSDKFWFGSFIVPKGQSGGVDKGHPKGEVFYVHQGKALVYLPGLKKYLEAEEGDAIVIPPGEDHQLRNISSDKDLVTTWVIPW